MSKECPKKLVFILTEYKLTKPPDEILNEFENLKSERIQIYFKFGVDATRHLENQYLSILEEHSIEHVGNPCAIIFNFPYYYYGDEAPVTCVTSTHELLDGLFREVRSWSRLTSCELTVTYLLNGEFAAKYGLEQLHEKHDDLKYVVKRFKPVPTYVHTTSLWQSDRVSSCDIDKYATTYIYNISK